MNGEVVLTEESVFVAGEVGEESLLTLVVCVLRGIAQGVVASIYAIIRVSWNIIKLRKVTNVEPFMFTNKALSLPK